MEIYKFLETNLSYYAITIFTALSRHAKQCLFPLLQSAIYFTNVSRLVLEIFTFFSKNAQDLNTLAE